MDEKRNEVEASLEEHFFAIQSLAEDCLSPIDYIQKLCTGFSGAVSDHLNELDAFETHNFANAPSWHPDYQKLNHLKRMLSVELLAWKIIISLSKVRDERNSRAGSNHPLNPAIMTESEYVTLLIREHPVAGDIQTVVEVLEDNYAVFNSSEEYLSRIGDSRFSLTSLTETERIQCNDSSAALAQEPLFEIVFRCLRAGETGSAIEAVRRGGLPLFAVNIQLSQWDTTKIGVGSAARLRWKRIAWKSSNDPYLGPWERAVWGILCGNHVAALPVAQDWEDEAWIYLKCFIDRVAEKAVNEAAESLNASVEALPDGYWTYSVPIETIFERLGKSQFVEDASARLLRQSVKHALTNDGDKALAEIEHFNLSASEAFASDEKEAAIACRPGLRFALHILLLMNQTGRPVEDVFFGRFCYLYCQALASDNDDLKAFYLTKIPAKVGDQPIYLRYEAVLRFFRIRLRTPIARLSFLKSVKNVDKDLGILVAKTFVKEDVEEQLQSLSEDTIATFSGLFELFSDDRALLKMLLRKGNWTIRRIMLQPEPDAQKAREIHAALMPFVERFWLAALRQKGAPKNDNLLAEFICWSKFFDLCELFFRWNTFVESGNNVAAQKDAFAELLEKAFQILLTTDWFVAPVADEERERPDELKTVRSMSFAKVYSTLIDVLCEPVEEVGYSHQINTLENLVELTNEIQRLCKDGEVQKKDVGVARSKAIAELDRAFNDAPLLAQIKPNLRNKMLQLLPKLVTKKKAKS